MNATLDLLRGSSRTLGGARRGLCLWAVAGLVAAGCTVEMSETVHGSGAATTEFREVDGFGALEVHGSLDVHVVVGEQEHVVVEGDDNLIEYVESEVRDGRLQLRVRRGYRLDPVPRIEIGARELRAVSLLGGGDVEVLGIEVPALDLELTGGGDMTCTGSVESLSVDVTGSGNMYLRRLIATTVVAGITGSGDVETHARSVLKARITGSGDLVYRGEPAVESSVTGSGEVRGER